MAKRKAAEGNNKGEHKGELEQAQSFETNIAEAVTGDGTCEITEDAALQLPTANGVSIRKKGVHRKRKRLVRRIRSEKEEAITEREQPKKSGEESKDDREETIVSKNGRLQTPDKEQSSLKHVGTFKNKEKVLVLCTRGTGARFRHLLLDFVQLLPHAKKDSKLDTKKDREIINEVADMKGCTSVAFFETRKRRDLYIWFAKTPNGPSAKFLVQNVHTMSELRLSGNHLKGSRPIVSFSKGFEKEPHWLLIKELLKQIFVVPRHHHKSKPFFDHVLSFSVADGRVWMRNYQVVPFMSKGNVSIDNLSLVEVGPRLCLQPIKVFEGSFIGRTLYHNSEYIAPNKIRRAMQTQDAKNYQRKVENKKRYKSNVERNKMPQDELADVFK